MKIKEIMELDNDNLIKSFTGTVVSLYAIKEISGKFPGKRQDAKVRDESGDEMYLCFAGKNNQQEDSIVGMTITINASKTSRGEWTGLKKKVDDYKGKEYHKIWVTDSAKISLTGKPSAPSGKQSSHDKEAKTIILTNELIESNAKAWIHTYEVAAPLFKEAGISEDKIPERITQIMISAAYGQSFVIDDGDDDLADSEDDSLDKEEKSESDDDPFSIDDDPDASWKDTPVANSTLGNVTKKNLIPAIMWLAKNDNLKSDEAVSCIESLCGTDEIEQIKVALVQKKFQAKKLSEVNAFIENHKDDLKTFINALFLAKSINETFIF